MNFAHIHLIINHFPLLTMPLALIFLIFSLKRKNEEFKKFSLVVLILTAATVLPVYLTGEPAEKVIEHLPGVIESQIEAHEEAAELSLILTLVSGVFAIGTLLTLNHPRLKVLAPKLLILICLGALVALGYTANLGGKIRHPETSESRQKS